MFGIQKDSFSLSNLFLLTHQINSMSSFLLLSGGVDFYCLKQLVEVSGSAVDDENQTAFTARQQLEHRGDVAD